MSFDEETNQLLKPFLSVDLGKEPAVMLTRMEEMRRKKVTLSTGSLVDSVFTYYLRDADRNPIVTVMVGLLTGIPGTLTPGNVYFRGIAVCSAMDAPNKRTGHIKAQGMLDKALIYYHRNLQTIGPDPVMFNPLKVTVNGTELMEMCQGDRKLPAIDAALLEVDINVRKEVAGLLAMGKAVCNLPIAKLTNRERAIAEKLGWVLG